MSLARRQADVSILVLVDQPLPRGDSRGSVARFEFQSLFCWITLLGDVLSGVVLDSADDIGVSILVLLDHPLRRDGSASRRRTGHASGFNPCSAGSALFGNWPCRLLGRWISAGFNPCSAGSAPTCLSAERSGPSEHVSILVLLDQPPRAEPSSTVYNLSTLFQSLFCWISPHVLDRRRLRWRPEGVSILVLLDQPPRGLDFVTSNPTLTVFQSLFCWISLHVSAYAINTYNDSTCTSILKP